MNSIVLKSRSVINITKRSNKIGAIQMMRQRKVKAIKLIINHAFSTDLRSYMCARACMAAQYIRTVRNEYF